MKLEADVAILGSGFAGSLAGLILARGGLRPVVIDRAVHPRFAIGESSTPVANFVLRDLALRHQLDWLLPLARYGSWRRSYPHIVRGRKRGFSYFAHVPHEEFVPRPDHANELLVAASVSDEHSDTHWLRADVDALIASKLEEAGVPLWEGTSMDRIQPPRPAGARGWELWGRRGETEVGVRARFVIDATGEGGALARVLGVPVSAGPLATRSRALFAHFRGLGSWHEWLREHGAAVDDHPFCCDDAAQHQLLDGAWMWILRFDQGTTSAGFAIDAERFPRPADLTPAQEWQIWLDRYPSVAHLFRNVTIVDPPGRIVGTGLLPRRASQAAGPDWAMLPHTAGFIDPLHSSGIAHSLCGVERLADSLLRCWNRPELQEELRDYERAVFTELEHIDRMVHSCYRALGDCRLFTACSMLYFVAATWYEHQRLQSGRSRDQWFLCANDDSLRGIVREFHQRLVRLTGSPGWLRSQVDEFERDLAAAIRPFNRVGLCDPAAANMYRYTAPPPE